MLIILFHFFNEMDGRGVAGNASTMVLTKMGAT